MKKIVLMLVMSTMASFAMMHHERVRSMDWQNASVDETIPTYFNLYFIGLKGQKNSDDAEKIFSSEATTAIINALMSIPTILPQADFDLNLTLLVTQFAENVSVQEEQSHGSDKAANKEIDARNKAIAAHNKIAKKNKNEIKALLKSKSNPVETVGGLAALIFEYSDRAQDNNDKSLKLFKRYIALRSDGYYKEYFLYDVVDDEKTSDDKKPRYFYKIKTHRPKSWSSLVGLGNDYVDKRGWLSYTYGKLKYPLAIGAGVLAYRNRDAISGAINKSGIKETRVGKFAARARDLAAEGYTKAGALYNQGITSIKKKASAVKDYYRGSRNSKKSGRSQNRQKEYEDAYTTRPDEANQMTREQAYDKAYEGYVAPQPEEPTMPSEAVVEQEPVNSDNVLQQEEQKEVLGQEQPRMRSSESLQEYQDGYDKAHALRDNVSSKMTKGEDYDNAYQGYTVDNAPQPEEPIMQPNPVAEQEPVTPQTSEPEEPIMLHAPRVEAPAQEAEQELTEQEKDSLWHQQREQEGLESDERAQDRLDIGREDGRERLKAIGMSSDSIETTIGLVESAYQKERELDFLRDSGRITEEQYSKEKSQLMKFIRSAERDIKSEMASASFNKKKAEGEQKLKEYLEKVDRIDRKKRAWNNPKARGSNPYL